MYVYVGLTTEKVYARFRKIFTMRNCAMSIIKNFEESIFARYNTIWPEDIKETGNQWNITHFYGAMELSFEKYRETLG